jgi:pilus assembly protein CpaB
MDQKSNGHSSTRGLVVGMAIGFMAGALLVGLVASWYLNQPKTQLPPGWELEQVVVATRDLPKGHVVLVEDIAQRSVPGTFVTSSVIRPEQATYVLGTPLLVEVQKGDLIYWTQFKPGDSSTLIAPK